MAGMHMGVDESRRDQLVARVDLVIDGALEALADEQHGVAFVDQFGMAPKRMPPLGVADQPAASDTRAHENSLSIPDHPYTDKLRGRAIPAPISSRRAAPWTSWCGGYSVATPRNPR